jgi:hypothetical protein
MPKPQVAPPTPIWAADARGLDPKRSHRFVLYLNDVPSYFVKTVGVPQMTINQGGSHKFLGHEFKFPGGVKWEGDIMVKLVDTIDFNMAQKFMNYIRTAGYVYPSKFSENSTDVNHFKKTISKAKFPFSKIKIQRIDSEGNTYETWVLNNPWVNKVNFGNASYEEEKLLEVDVSFTYDWAELRDETDQVPSL